MSSPLAVLFRRKKRELPTNECKFFHGLRKCKPALADIIELAVASRDLDLLYHLLFGCSECRSHVRQRNENIPDDEMDALLSAGIDRIKTVIAQKKESNPERHI